MKHFIKLSALIIVSVIQVGIHAIPSASAATPIWSGCGVTCAGNFAGSATGWNRSIVSTGCYSGQCLKLVSSQNGSLYGAGNTSIVVGAISGLKEMTVEYKVKLSKSATTLAGGNIKGIRVYYGGGNYIYSTIDSHFGYAHYMSYWDAATLKTTSAVSGVHLTPDNPQAYCTGSGGNYSCPARMELNFNSGIPANTWKTVRLYLKLPSSASAADGTATLWIDGVKIYDLVGVKCSAGSGAVDNFTELNFYPSSEATEPFEHWMDEMVIYSGYVAPDGSTPPAQYCGDKTCNNNETCSFCPGDCGVCAGAKKGDLNNDSKVDVTDLGIFLSSWGATNKPSPDLNQDGRVDVSDLGILLSNWG